MSRKRNQPKRGKKIPAIITNMTNEYTMLKCPCCAGRIRLDHGSTPHGINDNFGMLNVNEQNYSLVVCMNVLDNGIYCEFAANLEMFGTTWSNWL